MSAALEQSCHERQRTAPTRKTVERRLATGREFVKMLLPVGAICIAYGVTGALPNVYPADYVEGYYPLFLLVMLGVYLAVMATACFVPKLRRYAVHYAYLVAAVFLLVELSAAAVRPQPRSHP